MRIGALVRGDDQHAREVLALARSLGADGAETYLLLDGASAQHAAAGAAARGAAVPQDADPAQLYAAARAVLGDAPPEILLIPDGPLFDAVGPRIAGALGRTAARDVGSVEAAGGGIRVVKGAFGGKAEMALETAAGAVIGVRQGAAPEADLPQAAVEMAGDETAGAPLLAGRSAVRDASADDLGAAKVIVSGGRGLGSAEAYQSLREVAQLLGASLGASRAAVDEGWASPSQQVGITGQKVAPEVYLAIGISGASQHLSGMSGSKVVIAVNRDDKAPIFAAADVGVVADWHALWPELRRALAGG